jgi:hypothetical protein
MALATVFFAQSLYAVDELLYIGSSTFLLLLLGFALGWGTYLNVAFPNVRYINESEVEIIDRLATRLYKKPTNALEFSNWCFIAFTFRSMLFYPLFIALAALNPAALLWGLGVLLMPVIYWLRRYTPERHAVRIAEAAFGAWLGLLVKQSLGV